MYRSRMILALTLALSVAATAAGKDNKPVGTKQDVQPKKTKVQQTARPRVDRFVLVEVEGDIVVMKNSEMVARNKELDGEYRAAFKVYLAEKRTAEDAGEKFTQPGPVNSLRRTGLTHESEEKRRKLPAKSCWKARKQTKVQRESRRRSQIRTPAKGELQRQPQ